MSIKYKILELFENNRHKYFSGEDLAKQFNVSRVAIWKVVKQLQNEGYQINAITNKGYCLLDSTDILSKQGIEKFLNESFDITVYSTVLSTNILAKEKALQSSSDFSVIIANEQTAGIAKNNKKFFSPNGTGIYMSIILKPKDFKIDNIYKLTTLSTISVCKSIEKLTNKKTLIKNKTDIYLDDKKIAGILSEALFEVETNLLEYIVIGIGINVYKPKSGFPKNLDNIAGAIYDYSTSDFKNNLVAEILNTFTSHYRKHNYLELEYEDRRLYE